MAKRSVNQILETYIFAVSEDSTRSTTQPSGRLVMPQPFRPETDQVLAALQEARTVLGHFTHASKVHPWRATDEARALLKKWGEDG